MSKPRIASTASAQFVYDDPRAAITRPDQFASLSHYFIANWLPGVSPNGLKILMRLRSLGYYQPKTGIQRGDIDIDQAQLAEQCGMGLRTLQRIFSEDPILAKYVQRVFQVERDKHGRIIREHYVYVVKMDDVLIPQDEAKLMQGQGKVNGRESGTGKETGDRGEADPTRQNGGSVNLPTRQNGGSDYQSGIPMRQNGASARQNGGSYKESLTSVTKENTSDTLVAAPELSASLSKEKEPDQDKAAVTWSSLLEAEQQPWIDQARRELVAIHAGSGITPKPKLVEVRAKNLYEMSLKEKT